MVCSCFKNNESNEFLFFALTIKLINLFLMASKLQKKLKKNRMKVIEEHSRQWVLKEILIPIILSLLSLILNIHGKIVHFFIPLGFFGASRTFFLSKKLTETDLSDGTTDPETVDFFLMVFKLWKLVPSLSDKSVAVHFVLEVLIVDAKIIDFSIDILPKHRNILFFGFSLEDILGRSGALFHCVAQRLLTLMQILLTQFFPESEVRVHIGHLYFLCVGARNEHHGRREDSPYLLFLQEAVVSEDLFVQQDKVSQQF